MANTVNINQTVWDGTKGSIHYVLSSDGTALTDTVLVDISALSPAPASIKIRSLDVIMNGNFSLIFEMDATTDQEVERLVSHTDATHVFIRDYTDAPNGGKPANDKAAAGFTGDLLLTSSGLANLDSFNIFCVFYKDS
jgi:hypothetical protein